LNSIYATQLVVSLTALPSPDEDVLLPPRESPLVLVEWSERQW
jgi:hypothetical protein